MTEIYIDLKVLNWEISCYWCSEGFDKSSYIGFDGGEVRRWLTIAAEISSRRYIYPRYQWTGYEMHED